MADTALSQLVADFAAAWSARNLERLRQLWALDDAGVYYLAADARGPALGPEAVDSYFRSAIARNTRLHWRVEGLRSRALNDSLATAFFFADWAAQRAEPAGVPAQAPVGGRLKCAATLLHGPAGWRFLHLSEAAYAPYRFFVSDFERDAEAGFPGMPRRDWAPGSRTP